MRILLDDKDYTISEATEQKMVNQIYAMVLERYEDLNKTLRLMMKPIARHVLVELEKKYGKGVRPPQGDDPSLHLVKLLLGVLIKGMPNVSIIVSTTPGSQEINAFDLSVTGEGESGGPLAADGDKRIREDDSREDAGSEASETVSNVTPLYPRLQA